MFDIHFNSVWVAMSMVARGVTRSKTLVALSPHYLIC
jgi:hypothetical protein